MEILSGKEKIMCRWACYSDHGAKGAREKSSQENMKRTGREGGEEKDSFVVMKMEGIIGENNKWRKFPASCGASL